MSLFQTLFALTVFRKIVFVPVFSRFPCAVKALLMLLSKIGHISSPLIYLHQAPTATPNILRQILAPVPVCKHTDWPLMFCATCYILTSRTSRSFCSSLLCSVQKQKAFRPICLSETPHRTPCLFHRSKEKGDYMKERRSQVI